MDSLSARKRPMPETANGSSKRPRETEQAQGVGGKTKPCTKFFSTTGCPFGEGCHFLHYVPGGYQAVAKMINPVSTEASPYADSDGGSSVKTKLCNKYNTAEGCKFGDQCRFAHGEWELGKPLARTEGTVSRLAGRLGPRVEPFSPTLSGGAPGSFGASATAKISVDASLAGAIIGKGGGNTKHICRVTGAKLSIRDHESDVNLKNIELEGNFDQIKEASSMVRELIVNISSAASTPSRITGATTASSGAYSAGGGYKTKLCENYPKGTCAFGDRCKFAHGQADLR